MKIKTKLLSMLALCLVVGANAQDVQVMDLTQCIDYALENNTDVKNSELEKKVSSAIISERLSTGLPQVNANLDLSDNFALRVTKLPAIILDPNAAEGEVVNAQFGTQWGGTGSVSVSQMIFDGSFFVGLEAARALADLTEKEHKSSQIDVIENVSKAYYAILVNNASLELLQRNMGRLDTLLFETEQMYINGFAEKIDVNRLKVEHNNLKTTLANTERGIGVFNDLLKIQMGMPVQEELRLAERLEDIVLEIEIDLGENFDVANRMDYSILESNKTLALLNEKSIKVQYLPKVDFYLSGGALAQSNTFSDIFDIDNEWNGFGVAGITVNMPIFDGFRKRSQIQQRSINVQKIDNSMSAFREFVAVDVERMQVNMRNSAASIEAQRENMEMAEEVYETTRLKYQQGIGSNLEVVTADAAYKNAQTNYFNSVYDALVAKIELDKALGRIL